MKAHLDVQHGEMKWAGEFDTEGYAVFVCEACDYSIGLKPGAQEVHKLLRAGAIAAHHARTTPDVVEAALALGVWGHLKEESGHG